jgi:hypothetical protein
MKRLFKIILLFAIIFITGVYFTIKTINTSFSKQNQTDTETVTVTSNLLNLTVKI